MKKKLMYAIWALSVSVLWLWVYWLISKNDGNSFTTQSSTPDMWIQVEYWHTPLASVIIKLTNHWIDNITSVSFSANAPEKLTFDEWGRLDVVVQNPSSSIWWYDRAYMKFYTKSNQSCWSVNDPHPINQWNNQLWSWTLDDINIKPWETCIYAITLDGMIWSLDNKNAMISAIITNTVPSEWTDQWSNNKAESKIPLSYPWEYFISKWKIISIEKEMYFVDEGSWSIDNWNNKWSTKWWIVLDTSSNNVCNKDDEVAIRIKVRSHWIEDVKNITIQDVLQDWLSYIDGSLELIEWESRCPSTTSYIDNKINLNWSIPSPYDPKDWYGYIEDVYWSPCVYQIRAKFTNNTVGTLLNNARLLNTNNISNWFSDAIYWWTVSSDVLKCNEEETIWDIEFKKEILRCNDLNNLNECKNITANWWDFTIEWSYYWYTSLPLTFLQHNQNMQYRLVIKNNTNKNIKDYEIRDTYIPRNFYDATDNWDSIDLQYDNISVPAWCNIKEWNNGIWWWTPMIRWLWPNINYVNKKPSYSIYCEEIKAWEEVKIVFWSKKPIKVVQMDPRCDRENYQNCFILNQADLYYNLEQSNVTYLDGNYWQLDPYQSWPKKQSETWLVVDSSNFQWDDSSSN